MMSFAKSVFSDLSGKFCAMTILFVMASSLVILLPILGFTQRSWLAGRMETAQIVSRALHGGGDKIGSALRDEIRRETGFLSLSIEEADAHHLLLLSETMPPISREIDLRSESAFAHMRDALWAVFRADAQSLRVVGRAESDSETRLAISIREGALKKALFYDACGVLLSAFLIAFLSGLLLFLMARFILTRPLRDLARNMIAFREAPEDRERILAPPPREDEIGEVMHALKDLESRLHESLRHQKRLARLGEAVGKMHHDLRNILASAHLLADGLQASQDPTVQRMARRLFGIVDRASRLCTQSLEYGRPENRAPLIKRVALRAMADELGQAVGLSKGGAIEWENRVPAALSLESDSEHLFRILLNLGRNAVQAVESSGKGGGRITVSAEARGDHVWIWIQDTGNGLPPRIQRDLFTPFVRGCQGFGLGLAISYDLARSQGGVLRLAETGAHGTLFELRLPRRRSAGKILSFRHADDQRDSVSASPSRRRSAPPSARL